MPVIKRTAEFLIWLRKLRDREARMRIMQRIDRLTLGNPGDIVSVGDGISEMRIHYGLGYRIYFTRRGEIVVLLLCGGDKSSQRADIAIAKKLARDWRDEA